MTTEFINQTIESKCRGYNIIVLKGFSPALIKGLSEYYSLLDDYVIEDGKIQLENINENRLMLSINLNPNENLSLCTIESFIKLSTHFADLSIFRKKICVLENNMLELYPNPTNTDIPDFDSSEFEDTDSDTSLFSAFYSFCINEDNVQRVQYIDNYSDSKSCVDILDLIPSAPFQPDSIISDIDDVKILSTKDGTLYGVLESLYTSMTISETEFAVEAEEIDEKSIKVFVEAARLFGCPIHLHKISRNICVQPRQELYDLLKSVWGYDSFRMLRMYNDLSMNHDIVEISQGAIIETVVQQAEKRIKLAMFY